MVKERKREIKRDDQSHEIKKKKTKYDQLLL